MKSPGWMVTAIAAAGAALVVSAPAPARAACTPPSISVKPTSGPPGQRVTITGQGFFSVCSDIVVPGPTTPPTPERGIRLQFVQGNETLPLAQVDADSQGKFSKEVITPLGSTTGDATIRAAGTSATADTAFVVTAPGTTTVRSTTTTTSRSTTTTRPSTTTTTEQTFPTLEPESTTTPTVKLKSDDEGRDWTGWIVLGIVGVGLGIFTVSWRILRAHPSE